VAEISMSDDSIGVFHLPHNRQKPQMSPGAILKVVKVCKSSLHRTFHSIFTLYVRVKQ
jgi:hypothetical protein